MINKMIKKIDRVSTIEEAIMLQNLGVNIISMSFSKDPKFNDDRVITKNTAMKIIQNLKKSKSVAELTIKEPYEEIIELIEELKVDYVQPLEKNIPSLDFRKELYQRNIGIIYSNIEVSYDDDPSWILSSFENKNNLNTSYYQIDILGDIENSWQFFKEESIKYPEELQLYDINDLAKEYPLLITLNYSANNIIEIINDISNIKGITMTLGENSPRNDIHYFQYSEILNILRKLR